MNHLPDTYPYGHAGCCGCACDLDLASNPAGLWCDQGNLRLYFFFCPNCSATLQAEGEGAQIEAIRYALLYPDRSDLAMTTSLALQAHGGDLTGAIEIGVTMPRIVHDAIAFGNAEASIIPYFNTEV